MDLMCYYAQQRSTFGESMVLSGGHVLSLQLLNGYSNYTHLEEKGKKHKCQSEEQNRFMPLVFTKAGLGESGKTVHA